MRSQLTDVSFTILSITVFVWKVFQLHRCLFKLNVPLIFFLFLFYVFKAKHFYTHILKHFPSHCYFVHIHSIWTSSPLNPPELCLYSVRRRAGTKAPHWLRPLSCLVDVDGTWAQVDQRNLVHRKTALWAWMIRPRRRRKSWSGSVHEELYIIYSGLKSIVRFNR